MRTVKNPVITKLLPANLPDVVLDEGATSAIGSIKWNAVVPWQVLTPWHPTRFAASSQFGTMAATSGNDWVIGTTGDDTLDGGAGADTMVGGTGNDTYYVDNVADVVGENAGEGIDTVQTSVSYTLGANVENLVLYGDVYRLDINGFGNNLDNHIIGNSYSNFLSGGAGNDTLDGGWGSNTLDGGSGNDTLIAHDSDLMIGGTGNDIYYISPWSTINEKAGEGIDTVVTYLDMYWLDENIENLILSSNSVYIAYAGYGNSLNNRITGNDGINIIDGGVGADTMAGGKGDDYYYLDNVGDVVIELAGEGWDVVTAQFDYTLGANLEDLALEGSAIVGNGNALDNYMYGNAHNNSLSGGAGDDELDGGAGLDTLVGGLGNDGYWIDNAGDVIVENAGEGIDWVIASFNYTLGANLEELYAYAAIGNGNELDNRIFGSSQDNGLAGGAGNDTLDGGEGNDTLDGEVGNDSMRGGKGDDIYYVDSAGDIVVENAGEGIDTVRTFISYTLNANVEKLALFGTASVGTGNALDNLIGGNAAANTLNGGAGHDTLDGAAGNDSMVGGAGNDTYYVDSTADRITELNGEGTDTVHSSVNWTLGANIENLVLTGSAVRGVGNTLNNTIQGNAVDNILRGGSGSDTMTGGAGADQFEFGAADSGRDTITDFASGQDLIVLSGFGLDVLEEGYNFMIDADAVGEYATILYNTATGILSFDEDGTGATASREIALLSNRAALTSADFFVF